MGPDVGERLQFQVVKDAAEGVCPLAQFDLGRGGILRLGRRGPADGNEEAGKRHAAEACTHGAATPASKHR